MRNYSGAYSLDGTTWTAFASPVTNAMAAPSFRRLCDRAAGGGPGRPRAVRVLHARRRGRGRLHLHRGRQRRRVRRREPRQVALERDRQRGRDQVHGRRRRPEGDHRRGRHAQRGAPNLFLQPADHAGPDWEIETKLSGTIQDGYQQGGLVAWGSGADFVKLDAISDVGFDRINRIELRSQVGGTFVQPQPNADVPAGTTNIWLRLKKTARPIRARTRSTARPGRRSATACRTPVASPRFGLYTVGVNAEGGTVTFDELQGRRPGRLHRWARERRAGDRRRDGEQDDRPRAARGRVQGRGDRRRRRRAQLQLGLRRRHACVDPAEPVAHLPAGRDTHGDGHASATASTPRPGR